VTEQPLLLFSTSQPIPLTENLKFLTDVAKRQHDSKDDWSSEDEATEYQWPKCEDTITNSV